VKWYIASTVFVLLGWYSAALRADEIPEYGPAHGTLIIVGGGSLKQTANLETFLRLAGGKNARLVVVPTAGGNKNRDGTVRKYDKDRVVAPWKALGITDVRMLHTHDPKVADTAEFAAALTDYGRVVRRGPAMEPRRLIHEHPNVSGISQSPRTRRRYRRQFGRGDHSG
jgi:hypothetical protein